MWHLNGPTSIDWYENNTQATAEWVRNSSAHSFNINRSVIQGYIVTRAFCSVTLYRCLSGEITSPTVAATEVKSCRCSHRDRIPPQIRTFSREILLSRIISMTVLRNVGPDCRQTRRIGFLLRFWIDDGFPWFPRNVREGEIRELATCSAESRESPVLMELERECVSENLEKIRSSGSLSVEKGASQTIHGFIIM